MIPTTLLCLHGFSQNGGVLRAQLAELTARLPAAPVLALEFPDAPRACSPESVARLSATMNGRNTPAPHLCFWNATNDGREYRGWSESLQMLRARARTARRVGLLGFSQGALVTSALCALAVRDQFPKVAFAVMVAGRKPRADALAALFDPPLSIPSLHVWGERDAFAMDHSPELVECFDAAQREVVTWRGPHVVPTRGGAADAIVAFVQGHVPVL